MSYKKSNWVPYDPTLSFEQNVTQGGTTTADKLNNMETGIGNSFDKTSDTIGGRNYLLNTADYSKNWVWDVTPSIDGSQVPNILHYPKTTISSGYSGIANQVINDGILQPSTTYTASFYAKGTGTIRFFCHPSVGVTIVDNNTGIKLSSNFQLYTITFTTVSDLSGDKNFLLRQDFSSIDADQNTVEAYIYGLKLEKGSVATDWTPAPEDKADDSKVVHSTDMRKPASDVAGIEEVNAKQDKIGYTPADDSKVVHTTVNQLNSTDLNTVLTAGFYQSTNGTNGIPSGDNWTVYQVIPLSSANGVQVTYGTNNTILGMRSWNYSAGTLGFTSWVQFADDSKVAHLSGANNFDTVPTVDNKSIATTDDVSNASNTVLTSANNSISKLLQQSSSNSEDSATTDSTSDTSNFYYWTE